MIIPQEIFDLYNQTVSDFTNLNFGVPCTLVYGANREQCPNCIYNSVAKTSSGVYKSGGPFPFNGTICPYCAGVGYNMIQQNPDTIKMRVYFNRKDFLRIEMPITITNSMIQTIGFITDLPKLQKAQEMVANTNVENYSAYRYILAGEILPCGLGPVKNFCVAFWNRNQ